MRARQRGETRDDRSVLGTFVGAHDSPSISVSPSYNADRFFGEALSRFAKRGEYISRSEMSTNKIAPLTIENVLISLREVIFRSAKCDYGIDSHTRQPNNFDNPLGSSPIV